MEYDHKNIKEIKYLLDNFPTAFLATMKSLHLTEETITEFPDSKLFSLFPNLVFLSITYSTLSDFKPLVLIHCFPNLKKLDLSFSVIPSIKSILPLAQLQKLESLDLSESSIKLDRYYLLSFLLHGHTIKETTDKPKKINRAFTLTKLILNRNKPAQVPREGNFPMLQTVNKVIITEDEVQTVKPKKQKQKNITQKNPIFLKVKKQNEKLLKEKEQFSTFRIHPNVASTKPKIDTFSQIRLEKDLQSVKFDSSESIDSEGSSFSESFEVKKKGVYVPKTKEEAESFLNKCKDFREVAQKPLAKKIYKFEEVCLFMYGQKVQDTKRVNAACEVMRIVNGVKQSTGISEHEVYTRLKSPKNLSLEQMHEFQQILLLDDEVKTLRLQSAYFEWWIKKIEKKHIEFSEHKAILALHHNRIFCNPLLGDKPEKSKKKRTIIKESKSSIFVGNKVNKVLNDEEPQYFEANFAMLFDPEEIKQGEVYFIKPIVKFEEAIEKLQNQMVEKERNFDNLGFGDKVLVKLEKIKKNIKEREGLRDRLTALYDQVLKLKKKFQENQTQFLYDMHEKKIDKRELLRKHDFRRFDLPSFVFPILNDSN